MLRSKKETTVTCVLTFVHVQCHDCNLLTLSPQVVIVDL